MQKILLTICLYCISISFLCAQDYHNEWIDFDQTYYKIKVGNKGLHRISSNVLQNAGLPLDASGYQLFYQGEEMPLYTSSEGELGANDYIEFYGQRNDGRLDTELYADPNWQPQTIISNFSDSAHYFLTWKQEGNPLRFKEMPNDIVAGLVPQASFMHQVKGFPSLTHNSGKSELLVYDYDLNADTQYDLYPYTLSSFDLGEGFTSASLPLNQNVGVTIATPAAISSNSASLTVRYIYLKERNTNPSSTINVMVNNTLIGNSTFTEDALFSQTFTPTITSENTNIQFEHTEPDAKDNLTIGYVQLDYERAFDFANESAFYFEIQEALSPSHTLLQIKNFNAGNTPVLYDLAHQERYLPILNTTNNSWDIYLPKSSTGTRQLLLSNTDPNIPINLFTELQISGNLLPDYHLSVQAITQLEQIQFTNFLASGKEGDFVIIYHPSLTEGSTNPILDYKLFRESSAGGNHQVSTIDITELYEQFAWGIETHPLSIRTFINYALENWAISPQYILLVGNGQSYADKQNTNYQRDCLIPSFGHYPSDNLLTSPNNTALLGQIPIGRIPANTSQEVHNYLQKVIEYETADLCDLESNRWRKKAIFTFDTFEPFTYNTSLLATNASMQLAQESRWAPHTSIYSQLGNQIIENPDFQTAFNEGAAVITHWGHSDQSYGWNFDLRKAEDYNNQGRYPFVIGFSNFNGGFFYSPNNYVQAIDFINAPQKGAIAWLAPPSVYANFSGLNALNDNLYQQLFHDNYNQTLGKVLADFYSSNPDLESSIFSQIAAQQLHFLGDPSIVITPYEQPEFAIESGDITFHHPTTGEPLDKLPADLDNFDVQIAITNIGKVVSDSISLIVQKQLISGERQTLLNTKVPSPSYQSYYTFNLPNQGDPIMQMVVGFNLSGNVEEHCTAGNNNFNYSYFGADLVCENYDGGIIGLESGETELAFCFGTADTNRIEFLNSSTTEANYQYIITDEQGNIVQTFFTEFEFGLDLLPEGNLYVYGVAYADNVNFGFSGLETLQDIQEEACASLSDNFILVSINHSPAPFQAHQETISLCNESEYGNTIFNLSDFFLPTSILDTFQLRGTWAGAGVIDGQIIDASDIAPGIYEYTYTDMGTGACSDQIVSGSRSVLIEDCNNHPPIAIYDTLYLIDITEGSINVLANDTDPDGHLLYLVDLETTDIGEATINSNGDILFSYFSEVDTTIQLSYTITDLLGIEANQVTGNLIIIIEAPIPPEPSCPGSPGQMFPFDREIIACDGEDITAQMVDVDANYEGFELFYVLHDSPNDLLGNVLTFSNQPTITSEQLSEVPRNQVFYLSTILTSSNDNAPDLFNPCLKVAPGTPTVLLTPIIVDVFENCCCSTPTKLFVDITGGFPMYSPDKKYTITGDFTGTYTVAELENLTFSLEAGQDIININISDENLCSTNFIWEFIPCPCVPPIEIFEAPLTSCDGGIIEIDLTYKLLVEENWSGNTAIHYALTTNTGKPQEILAISEQGIFEIGNIPGILVNETMYITPIQVDESGNFLPFECSHNYLTSREAIVPNPIIVTTKPIYTPDCTGDQFIEMTINSGYGNQFAISGAYEGTVSFNQPTLIGPFTDGTHSITITDQLGCSTESTFEMNCAVTPFEVTPTLWCETLNTSCYQKVVLNIQGPYPPYTITAPYDNIEMPDERSFSFDIPIMFFEIDLVITDAQGTNIPYHYEFVPCLGGSIIAENCSYNYCPESDLNAAISFVCLEESSNQASVVIDITGGTAPYTYGLGSTKNGEMIELNETHNGYIMDANGCITYYESTYDGTNCITPTITAVDDVIDLLVNTPTTILPLTNDIGEAINIIEVLPINDLEGSLTINPDSNTLNYIPKKGYRGWSNWEYVIEDKYGQTDTAAIGLYVYYKDFIWPGDINNNGLVNVHDVLSLGITYGSTGPVRENASFAWQEQSVNSWNEDFINVQQDTVNYCHADCNGDGIIDLLDRDAIYANYQQITGKTTRTENTHASAGAELFWVVTDTIIAGLEHNFSIHFGTPELPAQDVYGIAFTASFEMASSDSIELNNPFIDFNNSWLGMQNNDMITFDTCFKDKQQWDIALTRIDQKNRTGYAQICQVQCILEMGSLKTANDTVVAPILLSLTNVQVIGTDGIIKTIPSIRKEIYLSAINPTINTHTPPSEIAYSIYPNPATHSTWIHYQNPQPTQQHITLYNLQGQAILIKQWDTQTGDNQYRLELPELANGYYILEIHDGTQAIRQKLLINK